MTDQGRQRQMDFIFKQQARFESSIQVGQQELAQIRRMLISDIRQARRDRAEMRTNLAALADAQMRNQQALAKFQSDRLEEASGNGDGSQH
jgi:hypothetical protein